MKLTFAAARVLLGTLFTIFGLNGFLHFLPMKGLPQGPALQFISALAETPYMSVVFALQLVSGVLLLANRFVPLALTLLAPVLVNILLFHIFMDPAGVLPGAIATVLWAVTAYRFRPVFQTLLHV